MMLLLTFIKTREIKKKKRIRHIKTVKKENLADQENWQTLMNFSL